MRSPTIVAPASSKPRRHRRPARRRRAADIRKYGLLTLIAIPLFVVPVWLVVVTSFKPLGEAIRLDLSLPGTWAASDNYREVFTQGRYVASLLNSLVVTGASVAILLLVGSMAAWCFARNKRPLMQFTYYVCVLGVLLPPAIVPTVFLMRLIGIDGTRSSLVLFTVGTRLALVIFLMTGFVRAIPNALEEAGRVDGASMLQLFTRIVLPLMRPILFTVGVILTILIWNDFFAPFFLIHGPDRYTLPLSLYQLAGGSVRQIPWHLVFAHLTLVSLPLIVVYLFAQKQIVDGLLGGALKG